MDPLTPNEKQDFINAKLCHICQKPFTPSAKKHRDHCLFTGKYRGPAHEACNLIFRNSPVILVVFHNLSGYDSHFFIKDLVIQFNDSVSLLPINKEKYISFTKEVEETKVKLRFIDSFRFMASSLENLASYLSDDDKAITRKHYKTVEEFRLFTRKGVFPYEYIDDWKKLDEAKLPSIDQFYSSLSTSSVSEEDYQHGQRVWETFNIKSLGEYSDHYLKTYVLLPADVFQNLRKRCFSTYSLDALHYYTAPGLAFDAMLKCTNVQFELFTDLEMFLFIEKGIRSGVSQCCNRYGKANNRYMGSSFNPDEEKSYLMYFVMNNLYGAAMCVYLPTGNFKWTDTDLDEFSIPDDSPKGYNLEVDLEYPRELQE